MRAAGPHLYLTNLFSFRHSPSTVSQPASGQRLHLWSYFSVYLRAIIRGVLWYIVSVSHLRLSVYNGDARERKRVRPGMEGFPGEGF